MLKEVYRAMLIARLSSLLENSGGKDIGDIAVSQQLVQWILSY